jgi:hypothetical protein
MNFTIIKEQKQFHSLHKAWNHLLKESRINSIYLTWEWLYTWWQTYGEGRELFIICAFNDSRLVAIFPLLRRKHRRFDLHKKIVLEFLGTGENKEDEVTSNMMEPVVHPDFTPECYQHLFSFLVNSQAIHYDQLVLNSVKANSAFTKAIMSFFHLNGHLVRVFPLFTNGATVLESGWDGFINSLGKKTRKKIIRERRLLTSNNHFNYFFLEDERDFEWMFDAFAQLSLKRWNNGGSLSSKKFRVFHKNFAKRMLKKGLVKLSLMQVGNRIIAGNLDYCYGDTVYGYQTAFDPEFKSKVSVGIQGMLYCIEEAAREGYRVYDWYRIEPGSYKERFVSQSEDILELIISRKGIIQNCEMFLQTCKYSLKQTISRYKQQRSRFGFHRYYTKLIRR